jgi:hypothetical protein
MKSNTLQRVTALFTICGYTLALSPHAGAVGAESEAGSAEQPKKAESSATGGDSSKATVRVRSTGAPVTVAQITGRMAGAGVASGGQTVAVMGVSWKDLCISPCSFELDPGLHELMVYGDGIPSATKKLQLGQGQNDLLAKPGSSLMEWGGVWLTAFGIVAVSMGVMFMFLFTEDTDYKSDGSEIKSESGTKKLALPLLLGGLGGTGLGIGLIVAGGTSFDRDPHPGADRAGATRGGLGVASHNPWGMSYRGTF